MPITANFGISGVVEVVLLDKRLDLVPCRVDLRLDLPGGDVNNLGNERSRSQVEPLSTSCRGLTVCHTTVCPRW
jgi:hypothetical protein